MAGYRSITQTKNVAWFLPRPKPDHYKGGMPLYCEEWLLDLASDILDKSQDDCQVLNLFCGMNKRGYRVDISEKVSPDLLCDAHNLIDKLPSEHKQFDIILADPPYSNEEATQLYGTPKLNYNKWTEQCSQILVSGGLLIVYHKFVMPNPDPEQYVVVKRVFIGNRTRHLPRVAIYFQKK